MIKNYFITVFIILLLSNCASYHHANESMKTYQSFQDYQTTMSQFFHWEIQGKIAFLQKNKRQSANIFWNKNEQTQNQTLNLTTYLGINVLTLSSHDEQHTLKTNGQIYNTQNISSLIQEITNYQLPIEALSSWLKGLPYSNNDIVKINPTSFLPIQISTHYEGEVWKVYYQKYQTFEGYQLPSQLMIKQNDFTLKIMIHQWTRL